MTWQQNLSDMLGSYFCDSSIEEGAAELVFTSEDDPAYHQLCVSAFEQGIKTATQGTAEQKAELVAILRRANLAAATPQDVLYILEKIRGEYLKQYHVALTRLVPPKTWNERF